jgi:hypothetical protein
MARVAGATFRRIAGWSSRWIAVLSILCVACTPASLASLPSPSARPSDYVVSMVDGHFGLRIYDSLVDAGTRSGVDLPRATERILQTIDAALPGPRVLITIASDRTYAVPEIGIGGFTRPDSGDITVSVDPSRDLSLIVRDWLPLTLAHELHHSRRILRGPGYGTTLGEALVTEGLADTFARQTFPAAPIPPWVVALDGPRQRTSWTAARPLLDVPYSASGSTSEFMTAHQRWFFGTADQPRWAGYSIGFALVESYLRAHQGATAASLVAVPATRIIAESGYAP